MGSIWEWLLDVYAAIRLHVGFGRLVGLSAIQLRDVELLRRLRLGMGAGCWRLQSVVGRRDLRRKHRLCSVRVFASAHTAATAGASSGYAGTQVRADSGDCGEQAAGGRLRRSDAKEQECFGNDCRARGDASEAAVSAAGV